MDEKQDQNINETIRGPLTIALSPIGVDSFVKRGQKLKKHRFFDGSEDYGMEMPSAVSKSLQKMAMTGLVYKIEQSVRNFALQRKDLMSLARCFAVAMTYRQFETHLWELIGKHEILIQWNRAHTRLPISVGVNSAAPAMQALLAKSSEGILASKQEVLKVVQAQIFRGGKTLPEEKKALLLLAIRYLNAIDPAIWLLLATSTNPFARTSLTTELQKLLIQYVGRSELPEYLALMLVEMVVIVGKFASDESATDIEERGKVFVSYELGTLKKSQEERTKVRIQVGNEANDFVDLKNRFDHEGSSKKTLDSFMSSGSRKEGGSVGTTVAGLESGGADMGLYYLTCLKDACKKMDISIDSFVNIIPHTKRTLINLILTI